MASRKENAKADGFMVVYLTKSTDVWRLLADGFFMLENPA